MVKLPVIVYNRKSQADVYSDAYAIRNKLEAQAKRDQGNQRALYSPHRSVPGPAPQQCGQHYIRKIKKTLVDGGIPEKEIAIKTGDKDELKNVDLLSPTAPSGTLSP